MADYPGIPTRHAPIKVTRGESMPPSKGDAFGMLLHHAKRWSPAGVLVLLLVLLQALGGKEFVVEMVGARTEIVKLNASVERLTLAVAALEKTTTKRLDDHFDAQAVRDNVQEYNLSLVCDLASAENEGRPHESWCDSEDGRAVQFRAPPAGHVAPRRETDTRWKQSKK